MYDLFFYENGYTDSANEVEMEPMADQFSQ